jgi:hypothetical protein
MVLLRLSDGSDGHRRKESSCDSKNAGSHSATSGIKLTVPIRPEVGFKRFALDQNRFGLPRRRGATLRALSTFLPLYSAA